MRLEVPLDYANTSAGTTHIAFVKSSAPNASTETQDVLFNPGGPGESGVGLILAQLQRVRPLIGDKHNIIGFDPRGVNNSGINLDCFPGDEKNSANFNDAFVSSVNSKSSDNLAKQWAVAGAWGDWCSLTYANNSAKYASTSAVAQDMLHYVDTLQNSSNGKLWYYGTSYGTVLGVTFATLYPDRIGRMILDGVEDSEDYYSGEWKTNVVDIDKTLDDFFNTCYKAGPDKCAFYASSPKEIEDSLIVLMEMLRKQPIAVSDRAFVQYPTIVTYELLESAVLDAMYTPLTQWPAIAKVLHDLSQGNGSSLALRAQQRGYYGIDPVEINILCLDAMGRYNLSTIEKWTQHVKDINSQSRFLGDSWVINPLACRQLHVIPPPSQQFSFNLSTPTQRTSFPILFVGNTRDPVTPLASAKRMHERFPGSALLVQNSSGHMTVNEPSDCTRDIFLDYFNKGNLPKAGTICQPNVQPFGVAA